MTTNQLLRSVIIAYLIPQSSAFQPDFLAQAIQVAQSVASGSARLDPSSLITTAASAVAPASIDEMLFAAANILDSSRRVGESKSKSAALQYPELLNDAPDSQLYDTDVAQLSRTISLSSSEKELFDLLIAARNRYCRSTTIRVAGGWVRDKLLQQSNAPCRDIDLVLSDVSGMEFVDMLRRYLDDENLLGMLDSEAEDDNNARQTPKKSSKGEKADHLQTASLCINGFDLDFVRLRNERYGDDRIPDKVDVGSIVEDAWRRDLTINALYYNINTNQVEDWTEQGLQDLQLRNIATPRPTLKTFLEDPTRLLRAIRFAAQLSWTIDPKLFRAAGDLRVRYAMQTKVSRDAMGKGIDACFGTRDPSRAIKLLLATNLIDVIFPLGDYKVPTPVQITIFLAGLDSLSRVQTLASRIFTDGVEWNDTRRRHLFYASFLKPLYELCDDSLLNGTSKRDRKQTAFHRLLAEGLRLSKSDAKSIEALLRSSTDLRDLVGDLDVMNSNLSNQEKSDLRWRFWKALRPLGRLRKESIVFSLTLLPMPLSVAVEKYFRLIHIIEIELGLDSNMLEGQYKIQPIVSGAQIQKHVLPGMQGKAFQEVLSAQEEWQIRHCHHHLPNDDVVEFDVENQLIDHLQTKFPQYKE